MKTAALKPLLTRPVAFHPALARICGSVHAALLLSQAIYWTDRTNDSEGWFYKTRAEWEEEITLTRYEQEGAREKLRALGFIAEEKRGVPSKLFYRVNLEAIGIAIGQFAGNPQAWMVKKRKGKNSEQHSRKPADCDGEKPQALITEITQRLSQTTGDAAQAPPVPALELSPPEPPKPSRHQIVVDAIRKCWPDRIPFTITDRDGAAIKKMLDIYANWEGEQIAYCVAFRAMSEGENPTAKIAAYIGNITTWASGPRNRFGSLLSDTLYGRKLHEYHAAAAKLLGYPAVPEEPAPEVQANDGQQALPSVWGDESAAAQAHGEREKIAQRKRISDALVRLAGSLDGREQTKAHADKLRAWADEMAGREELPDLRKVQDELAAMQEDISKRLEKATESADLQDLRKRAQNSVGGISSLELHLMHWWGVPTLRLAL